MNATAILLAAGMGTRLRPHTHDRPKALVPLGGVPLLRRTVAFLRLLAPQRIIIVSGSQAAMVHDAVADFAPDVEVIENPQCTLGSVVSLRRALERVPGSFIQCNVDHVYPKTLAPLLAAQPGGITAMCDNDRLLGPDDMKVWQEGGMLVRMSKSLETYNAGFTGIIICDAAHRPMFDVAHAAVLAQDACLGVEHVLGRLADEGRHVRIGDMSGHPWLEVDTPQDLVIAERAIVADPDAFNFGDLAQRTDRIRP